jgi:ATP-binding cassette, subfamily B, bacterial
MSRDDRTTKDRYRYLRGLRHSWRLLRPHGKLLAVVLSIVSGAALLNGVGDPLFLKILIDSLSRGDLRGFVLLAAGLVVIYTLTRAAGYLAAVLRQRLKNRIAEEVALDAFDTFQDVPYEEVAKRDPAYFLSRVYEEPTELTKAVDLAVQAVSSTVLFVGALVVCFWLSWKVAIILSVVVPVLLWVADRFGSRITDTTLDEKEEEAHFRAGLNRAVGSYKTAKVFGLQSRVRSGLGRRLGRYLDKLYLRVQQSSAFEAVSGTFLSYAEMAVLIGAGVQVLRGVLSIGGMFAFITAYWRVVNAFRSLTARLPMLAELSGNVTRVEELRALATGGGETLDHARVHLRGVNFAYEGRQVLQELDLSLRPGERLLVEGPNGSGKSTLAHLVAGFLRSRDGRARLPALQRMSCLLLPFGFIPGTVADNLDLAAASPQRRRRADALAGTLGLADKLDQDPASLSAGETKRLQVMMTLLKPADFYLLDEPLANIDAAGKDEVLDAIFTATRGKALMMIMHDAKRYRDRFDRCLELGEPRVPLRAARAG